MARNTVEEMFGCDILKLAETDQIVRWAIMEWEYSQSTMEPGKAMTLTEALVLMVTELVRKNKHLAKEATKRAELCTVQVTHHSPK